MELSLNEFRMMSDIEIAVGVMATVTVNGRTGSFSGWFFDEEGHIAGGDYGLDDLYVHVDWPGTKHSWPEVEVLHLSEVLQMVSDKTMKIHGYATWQS